jgi:hypothetical protein
MADSVRVRMAFVLLFFNIKIPPLTASLAAQRRYIYLKSMQQRDADPLSQRRTLSFAKQLPVLATLDAKGLTL